jgi:DNA-binding GntR family transcriptional regulator
MTARSSKLNRVTLGEQVLAEIKNRIMTGALPAGERLNETELAATLGISPTPIREALNRLRSDGLVAYSPGKGATVVALTPTDIDHLYDIREQLERLAVREAVARLTAEDVQHLDDLVARAESAVAATDSALLFELNEEFHQTFLRRSANVWLQKLLGELSDLLILARRPLTVERSGRETWAEHARVVAALKESDAIQAEAAMADHIVRVKRELLAQLEVGSPA